MAHLPRFLVIALAATVALFVVPGGSVLGRPLILLSTTFHELGHGLTALLMGGRFDRLLVHFDGSGVAHFRMGPSPWRRAMVAAGGPLGPPIAAAALFSAGLDADASRVALYVLGGALGLACVIWVRNVFGFLFIVAVAAAIGAVGYLADTRQVRIACAFLAIQMALSVFSRGDYLFKAYARTSDGLMPSDTAQMARALGLTYWFWGALIGLVSIAILAAGLFSYARFVR